MDRPIGRHNLLALTLIDAFLSESRIFDFQLIHSFAIRPSMTNRIAIGIALFLLALALTNFALGLEWHIFLGRKFLELVDLIAFWR